APGRTRGHARTGSRLSELAKLYFAHPDIRLSAVTRQQCATTYRLFQDHTDDAPLEAVTRRRVAEVKVKLSLLHRVYCRLPGSKELPLAELLKRYPAADAGLSAKTINRHLSALAALWKWARREGHLADDAVSPFADQARKTTSADTQPITAAELNKLFAAL